MQKRFILFLTFLIALTSSASVLGLFYYLDPYQNINLSYALMGGSLGLACVSWMTLIFYFIKKIYYRGDVGIYHVMTSMRQSFFLTFIFLGAVILGILQYKFLIPIVTLISFFLFLELFIRGIRN